MFRDTGVVRDKEVRLPVEHQHWPTVVILDKLVSELF